MALFYADSSALVKLVRDEPESEPLRLFCADAALIASELVLAEVPRAVRRSETGDRVRTLLARAGEVVEALALVPLDRAVLLAAGALPEPALRALDAIHVAAAIEVSPIDAFLTYDERQSAAARLAGLRTVQPGA